MARHHVVFGLGFGDEGKGTIVDYLSLRERPDFVVRFNGGAQAAHNVVLADGSHHTFSQYGSGTFRSARTFLSRHMLVNPITMLAERGALIRKGVHPHAYVDERALVTTPYHVGLNQLREAVNRHGSCGMGIGETKLWESEGIALRVGDLRDSDLKERLAQIRIRLLDVGLSIVKQASLKLDTESIARALNALSRDPGDVQLAFGAWSYTVSVVEDRWLSCQVNRGDTFIFEGAQGVLIDETHGWAPHYTWSTCTPKNALELADEAGIARDDIEVTGVLRAYHTRHGAGPLPTEAQLPIAESHNGQHPWQGDFRWGRFDGRLASYALEVSGRVDGLAITHLDRVPTSGEFLGCRSYEGQPDVGKPRIADAIPELISLDATQGLKVCVNALLPDDAPWITIESYGPTAADKRVPQ